jgi:hypothetical protein
MIKLLLFRSSALIRSTVFVLFLSLILFSYKATAKPGIRGIHMESKAVYGFPYYTNKQDSIKNYVVTEKEMRSFVKEFNESSNLKIINYKVLVYPGQETGIMPLKIGKKEVKAQPYMIEFESELVINEAKQLFYNFPNYPAWLIPSL